MQFPQISPAHLLGSKLAQASADNHDCCQVSATIYRKLSSYPGIYRMRQAACRIEHHGIITPKISWRMCRELAIRRFSLNVSICVIARVSKHHDLVN